jgi:hypothetical protein
MSSAHTQSLFESPEIAEQTRKVRNLSHKRKSRELTIKELRAKFLAIEAEKNEDVS